MALPALSGMRFALLGLILGLMVSVFMQGSRGIRETTEGRYTACARETLASQNPLEPVLNGKPHWTKPPLTYWAIGAGTGLLGANPWGARLYLSVAYLGTLAAVFALERAIWRGQGHGLGTLVFATAPMAMATTNTISTDALLMLWEAWAFAFFWLGVRTGNRHYTTLCWLALGLAVATKGPVGLLPLTAMIPAQVLLRRRGDAPRRLWTPEGLLLFLVVGLSWYVYVVARHPEVLGQWIGVEIIGRLEYDAHHRVSSEAIKILSSYVPILLLGTGPWLVWLLWLNRARLQPASLKKLLRDPDQGAEHVFLCLAVVIQFVLFAASSSRLPLYLAPLLVPLCVAVGRGLEVCLAAGRITHVAVKRVAIGLALALLVAKGASAEMRHWKDMTDIAHKLRDVPEVREDVPLTVLFRAPLNGLQFHLGRRLPTIYFQIDDPERLKQIPAAQAILPEIVGVANTDLLPRSAAQVPTVPLGSLMLVRTKDLDEFGPYFGGFGLATVTKSDKWTLLRVEQTIEIHGMVEDTSLNEGG